MSRVRFDPDKRVQLDQADLHPRLVTRLRDALGITSLLEMQALLHNHLRTATARGHTDDVVLCAPTGSGKTLAYALPILHSLLDRVVPRLRAIVVVPTRDLAVQVAQVFRILTTGTPVTIAVATGTQPIAREARAVRGAEILVATPGRLVDHVENTRGVQWHAVRYLVLDESDRLLQESYDDWLRTVMPRLNIGVTQKGAPASADASAQSLTPSDDPHDAATTAAPLQPPATGLLALAIHADVSSRSGSAYAGASQERVRKLLVSATQSYNPTHMVHLDMRRPTVFEVGTDGDKAGCNTQDGGGDSDEEEQKLSLPSTLVESAWVVRDVQKKPAALLHLLGWISGGDGSKRGAKGFAKANAKSLASSSSRGSTTLVFTNSVEAAHRLSRLLEVCQYGLGREGHVLEMSGDLSTQRRQEVIDFVKSAPTSEQLSADRVANGANSLTIVCSDVLSRGMDFFTVDTVINYDAPAQLRTYVHRAGRTARAGRSGHAVSLLLAKQAHHFRSMVYSAERGNRKAQVKNMDVNNFFTSEVEGLLENSLGSLKRVLTRERFYLIPSDRPLPGFILHELYNRTLQGDTDNMDTQYPDDDNDYPDDDIDGWEEDQSCSTSRKRPRDFDHDEDNGDVDILDGKSDVVAGRDTLSDILFAQIGRNMMLVDELKR